MANNRMFLVYRPTGECVEIGSRMGWGWSHRSDINDKINALFDRCEQNSGDSQDDFFLAMESCDNQPGCEGRFTYDHENVDGISGVHKLNISENVPYAKESE